METDGLVLMERKFSFVSRQQGSIQVRTRSLVLRPEIDHKHIAEDGTSDASEGFVVGMFEVNVAVLLAVEGQNEAVRAAFVAILRADVGAPFIGFDLLDLPLQIAKGILDFFDLLSGRSVFEL